MSGNGERVRMTKSEREELAKLVRERAKLGRVMAAERSAELLAEAEAQLAEIYEVEDRALDRRHRGGRSRHRPA